MLFGGWLRGGIVWSCLPETGDPWNPCKALAIFPSPTDVAARFVYFVGQSLPDLGGPDRAGEAEPIVVRVHTHDPACAAPSCEHIPVLDAVVWLGAIQRH